MKRLTILEKMLLLVLYFSLVPSVLGYLNGNSGSVINNYLIVPYVPTSDAPNIDGDITGDVWNFYPPIGMHVYTDRMTPEGEGGSVDFSSFFRVLYNEEAIYFLVTVVDDILYNSGANSYEQDCIEIYIDGDNSKGASYDSNDVQWRWVYGVDTINSGWADSGWADCGAWAWSETSNGYQLELRISQDSLEKAGIQLFDLSVEGDTIGFEVQVSDNDTNARDWISKWWNESDSSWQQPLLFGTALLGDQDAFDEEDAVTLEIPEISIADEPNIDGDTTGDAWADVPLVHMKVNVNDDLPDGGFREFSSYFKVAWSSNAFFFFGEVYDDVLYNSGFNSYEQDCWELLLDGDNSKGSVYDTNDVQWRYVYGYPVDSIGIPGKWADCGYWAWAETPYGYTFELRISQDSLQKDGIQLFNLTAGTVIGFEAQVSDNDTNALDCIAKWWSNSNNSWLDPKLFGTAELVTASTVPHPGPPSGIAEYDASVNLAIPAVLNTSGTIQYTIPVRSTVKVVLYNLAGQTVATLVNGAQSAGTHSVDLDASNLANGVYLVRIEACGTSVGQKMLLIK